MLGQVKTVKLNADSLSPTEPSIAALSEKVFVAGAIYQDVYRTEDGGKTFTYCPLQSPLGVYGDPVLMRGKNGTAYYVHLSQTAGKPWGQFFDRIVVQKSTDFGKTFNQGVGVGHNQEKVQDKPWLSSTSFKGTKWEQLNLTWTEFDHYGSDHPNDHTRILYSSSKNGLNWTSPVVISDKEGDAKDSDNTVEGATTCSDHKGRIYAVWAGHNKIYFDQSSNFGLSWGKDRVIANQVNGWDIDIPHIGRANGMPFIASVIKGDKTTLFVLYVEQLSANETILKLLKSDTYGVTWEDISSRLTSDLTSGNRYFFANMDIDPIDQSIHIIAYEQSYLGFIEPVVYSSKNGGGNFKRARVIQHKVPPPSVGQFFGDYLDIAAYGGVVRPIYILPRLQTNLSDVFVGVMEEKVPSSFGLSYFVEGSGDTKSFNFYHEKAISYTMVQVQSLFKRNKSAGAIKSTFTKNEFSVPIGVKNLKMVKLTLLDRKGEVIKKVKIKRPVSGVL